MTAVEAHPKARFSLLRLRNAALVVVAFAGPCLIGAPAPTLLLVLALLGYLTPSIRRSFRERTRNPIDLMLLLPVLALSLTFAIAARAPADLLYLFNFVPLLMALPYRWQLEGEARHDGLAVLARLALVGAGFALLVGMVQVFALGISRAGLYWLNPIQFADTALLLGFLSACGAWLPGIKHRWIYLAGPLFGIAATLLSGTRGAMLAVPVLALLAIVFAVATARNKKRALLISGIVAAATTAVVALPLLYVALAPGSELARPITRALSTFQALGDVQGNAKSDTSTRVRMEFLIGGAKAFAEAPLLGHGWAGMIDAVAPKVPEDLQKRATEYGHLHNDFLNAAVSAGVIGILSYIAILLAPLVAVLATPRDSQFAGRLYMALTLTLSYLVFGLTNVMLGYEFHTTLYGFLLMPMLAIGRDPTPRVASNEPRNQVDQPQSATGKSAVGADTA